MALTLTTKHDATMVINAAKTVAVAQVKTAAELDALVKTIKEQVPATVMVVK